MHLEMGELQNNTYDNLVYLYQDANRNDPTIMNFDFYGRTNLVIDREVTDEVSDWYHVGYGDDFNSNTVSAGEFDLIYAVTNGSPPGTTTVEVGEFYLGFITGQGIFGPWSADRSVFGWGHFRNYGCKIVLLDSAAAFNEGGITIGEPGSSPGSTTLMPSEITNIYSSVNYHDLKFTSYANLTYSSSPCSEVFLEFMSNTNQDEWQRLNGVSSIDPTNLISMEIGVRDIVQESNTNYVPYYNSWMTFRLIEEGSTP